MKKETHHLTRASVYFSVALILTFLFVLFCPLYISPEQMKLSLLIAGGKWVLLCLAAIIALGKRRNAFLHSLGRVCVLGSLMLVPYLFLSWLEIYNSTSFFFGSLIVAISVMIFRFYTEVSRLNLSMYWWYGWLLCLSVAVFLQMTTVFHLL